MNESDAMICNLLGVAHEFVKAINPKDPMPILQISQTEVSRLPKTIDLANILATTAEFPPHERVLVLEAVLHGPKDIVQNHATTSAVQDIQDWLFSQIQPPLIFAPNSAFDPNPHHEGTPAEIFRFQLLAVAGLRALLSLRRHSAGCRGELSVDQISHLAAYALTSDPWTRSEAQDAAKTMLQACPEYPATQDLRQHRRTTVALLQDIVRPKFAKGTSGAVTSAGQRAINSTHDRRGFVDDESELKVWKYGEPWVCTVFEWVLGRVDISTIEEHWPYIVPPILALMDDDSTHNRVRGCQLLQRLLQSTPPTLLARTGLGEVFVETLMPYLSHLPPLTPETESVTLLSSVYSTLLELDKKRIAKRLAIHDRQRVLDRILRVGIVRGYAQAGEYVECAKVLMTQTQHLVDHLGVPAVRHVEDILKIISMILTSSFATASPSLLHATVLTLQTLILNCWPRMMRWYGEVLHGVAICWSRIQGEKSDSKMLSDVRVELLHALHLLKVALAQDKAVKDDVQTVLEADGRLTELLCLWNKESDQI